MKFEGVININKPSDWTSQDVCAKLRSRLHVKRIGHTGTLDPMATGVLPVCIGNATRIIEYYDMDSKAYHATMKLGIETDTLDITGNILSEHDFSGVRQEDIIAVFDAYKGNISQIPPKYSALKINGRKAYELAREGKEVQIKSREITIYSNEITSIDLESGIIEFDVECSKGTYIRTMCDDIGRSLGCMATMTDLIRTRNGMFALEDAVDLAALIDMTDEEIQEHIIAADTTVNNLGAITVTDRKFIYLIHGNEILPADYEITQESRYNNCYRMYCRDAFIGVGELKGRVLQPRKVVIDADI